MKTLKYLVALVVLVVMALPGLLQAEGLRHLVWQTPGTNITCLALRDSTNNVALINGPQASHVRTIAYIANTNAAGVNNNLLVKVGGLFPTNGTADITIPPGSSHTFYFGEGYNGQISVRNVGTTTGVPFIYWDGGY